MRKILFLTISIFVSTLLNAQTHVFIIGDSTTEIWGSNWYPCMGWGARLQDFFDKEKVIVDDRAVGGRSSQTFYERHWQEVLADVNAGDYVFICFGANDSNKHAYAYVTLEDFQVYIKKYCQETRDKGAIPVLLPTINANDWSSSGYYRSSTYGTYPQAMGEAAEINETPYIDLNTFGGMLTEEVGEEYNTYYRYNNYKPGECENYIEGLEDNIHLQETGAIDFCRYVAEEIEKSDDERLKLLAEATKPRYQVTFDADDENAYTSISRSATFPEGINVTLKSYSVDSTKTCFWINDKGDVISESYVGVYVMQDHDEHFTAVYNRSSALQLPSETFRILSDRIIFTDDLVHTVEINTLLGSMVTSVPVQFNYQFNLTPGVYIVRIDGKRSSLILIK